MTTQSHTAAPRALPARPNLEHLKNEAKQRLEQARLNEPGAKLSEVQFRLAREYGFSSWRDLKMQLEALASASDSGPAGDWIGQTARSRIALHVRPGGGGYRAALDLPDFGQYEIPVDDLLVDAEQLSFSYLDVGALYEGRWDKAELAFVGVWRAAGMDWPLTLRRGVFPPAPVVEGLDGLWDGVLVGAEEGELRFSFRIRTDEHGTNGLFMSPDTGVRRAPLRTIRRDGPQVTFEMRTFIVTGPLSPAGDVIDGQFRKGDWTGPLLLTRRRPGAAAPQKTSPAEVALPIEALEAFVGTYRFSQGRVLVVRLEHGRLHSEYDDRPAFPLTPVGACEFRYPVGDLGLAFFEDDEGRGVRLKLENFVDWGRRQP